MSILSDFIGGGVEGVGRAISGVLDPFFQSEEEKDAAAFQLESLFQAERVTREETFRAQLAAKQAILVAELQQGDSYTKRARPTVVYAGLAMIAWNFCIAPHVSAVAVVDLPIGFWAAWGGICATWSVGRDRVRLGKRDRVTGAITG